MDIATRLAAFAFVSVAATATASAHEAEVTITYEGGRQATTTASVRARSTA